MDTWKKNKDADLHLNSVDGDLMVKYSMKLGVWVPPTTNPTTKSPSDSATRSHQSDSNLTPVKDTREEEEVPSDSPSKGKEKIKVDKNGEKHIT